MSKTIKGYKGFDKDLKCHGFQFKVGKTFKHDDAIELCKKGFHFCLHPLDVLTYYPLNGSKFAEVEANGNIKNKDGEDSKQVTDSITVKALLDLKTFIGMAVKFSIDFAKKKTTGDSAHSATTGDFAHSATTGYSAHSATTGYSAHSATTGNYAHSATTGYSAIACALGKNSSAKSVEGNWLVLAEYDENYKVKEVKTIKVDGKNIKADTWYTLKDGEFTEVK